MESAIEALERILTSKREAWFGLSQREIREVEEKVPSLFRDASNLKEILSKSSKKDVRKFQRFIYSIDSESNSNSVSRYLTMYYTDSDSNSERGGETIFRLLKLSNNVTLRNYREVEFHLGCLRILNADAIDEFESLDPDVQRQVWGTYYSSRSLASSQSCDDLAYLKLLKITGMNVVSNGSSVVSPEDYIMSLRLQHQKNSRRKKPSVDLDLSYPSKNFVVSVIDEVLDVKRALRTGPVGTDVLGLRTYDYQIILLLRAVFGEEKVREVVSTFTKSNVVPCSDDVIAILEDWDNLRSYPLSWIKNIAELKH